MSPTTRVECWLACGIRAEGLALAFNWTWMHNSHAVTHWRPSDFQPSYDYRRPLEGPLNPP